MKNINNIIMNPIRMRIIQTLSKNKLLTSSEICENIRDIPRTTLYRHIKILIENNILTVISEQKIRGSLERTLALNINEITKHNSVENATQTAFSFLMDKYVRFQKYFSRKKIDPGKDKIFLNNTVMMMTDEEFDQFLLELRELLVKYTYEFAEDRKVRDISIISAPDEN